MQVQNNQKIGQRFFAIKKGAPFIGRCEFEAYALHTEGQPLQLIRIDYDAEPNETKSTKKTSGGLEYENTQIIYPWKLLTNEELEAYDLFNDEQAQAAFTSYEQRLIDETPVKAITEERWNEMLEILPPCKWHTLYGFSIFHISERYTGEVVSWFAFNRMTNQAFEFYEMSYASDRDLMKQIERGYEL